VLKNVMLSVATIAQVGNVEGNTFVDRPSIDVMAGTGVATGVWT
jgi:hypothetical protein